MSNEENLSNAKALIQQLNLFYEAHQDRIMLRVGLSDNTEVSIWLTRRITKIVWGWLIGNSVKEEVLQQNSPPATHQEGEEPVTAAPAPQEKPAKRANPLEYKENYVESRKALLPEPLLAVECQVVELTDQPPLIEFIGNDMKKVSFSMTVELREAVFNMLQIVTKEAQWNLGSMSMQVITDQTVSSQFLH